MKQLVKLAQALVGSPRLLLLDEPSNGLDPPARKNMLELIRQIAARGDTRILISSHLLGDVEAVCDTVLILKDGRVAGTCDLLAERRADLSVVDLELATEAEPFLAALADSGCEVENTGAARYKVSLPETLDVRGLLALAESHGAVPRRLDHRRDTLQEIFLRAMEVGDDGA